MDARAIVDKLKGEADRDRTSLYLSRSTMQKFKDACGDIAPSRVMEHLMEEFIASHENSKNADIIADKAVVKSLKALAESLGYQIIKKN